MANDLAVSEIQANLEETIAKTKLNGQIVSRLMNEVLRKDEHYGVIPGTQKPTLLKSGAEKLAFTFRLDPQYQTEIKDLGNGHREVIVTCTIYSIEAGKRLGSGSGSCSTLESKYRYRGNAYEITELSIPKDYREQKDKYRKDGYGAKNIDGEWKWVHFTGERAENPDLADQYNTVLKMAQKRAFIASILTVLAVSDMFTQDVEDFVQTPDGSVNRQTGEIVEPKKQTPKTDTKPKESSEEKLTKVLAEVEKIKNSKEANQTKIEKLNKYMDRWDSLADELPESVYGDGMRALQELYAEVMNQDAKAEAF